jgi:hypothetical protein
MIGHVALFLAALATGLATALGFPASTASESGSTRVAASQIPVRTGIDTTAHRSTCPKRLRAVVAGR